MGKNALTLEFKLDLNWFLKFVPNVDGLTIIGKVTFISSPSG